MPAVVRTIVMSVIAGFATAMFAGGAMLLTRASDSSHDVEPASFAEALLAAASGAGIPVSATVLVGLLAIALVRSSVQGVRTHRDDIRHFGRSSRDLIVHLAVIAAIPFVLVVRLLRSPQARRIERAVLTATIWLAVVAAAAGGYALLALIGVVVVGVGTRMVMSSLEDPVIGPVLALQMGAAAAVMYAGLAALAACVALLYRFLRPTRLRAAT